MAKSLGTLTLDLVAKIGGFEAGLDKAARTAKKKSTDINDSLRDIGKGALKAAPAAAIAGLATLGTGLVIMGKQAIDSADSLNDLNKITGISVETLSRLGYAAGQSGTSMDSLQSALPKFSKNMIEAAKGTEAQAAAFDSMGISVTDAEGKIRPMDAVLSDVASKFAGYEDGAAKSALAMELFGKSGAELIPFLNNGADGLANLARESDNFGATISGDTARAADEFNDNMDKLKVLMSGVANAMIVEVLPALNSLSGEIDGTTDKTGGLREMALALLSPFRSAAELAVLLGTDLDSMGIAGVASLKAIGQALTGDVIGALQTMKAGNEEIIASYEKADERIAVIWGRTHEGMGAVAAETLQGIGIQWGGAIAEVMRYNSEAAKAVGAGTVLAPGVSAASGVGAGTVLAPGISGAAMPAKRQAPFVPKAEKKGGKSQAEKDQEALQNAYDDTAARLQESIVLHGQEGEAAKVAYSTSAGELAKLTQAQKDELFARALVLDATRAQSEAEKKALDEKETQDEEMKAFLDSQSEKLDALRSGYDSQNTIVQEAFAKRQAIIEEALASGRILEDEYLELSMQSQLEKFNQEQALRENGLISVGSMFGSLGQMASQFAGEQSGIAQGLFAVQKAFSVAQSIVAIQTGIANAMALPFPANLAAAATVAAESASIVSTIQATTMSFDGGGFTGFGTRTGGLDGKGGFMAMLHPNESVIDHTRGQTAGSRSEVRQTFNIQTQDANSFMASQRQIARKARRGLST